jgi:hypothetical protein
MLRGEERGKRTRICFASAWILWGRRLRVLGEVHLFVCLFVFFLRKTRVEEREVEFVEQKDSR